MRSSRQLGLLWNPDMEENHIYKINFRSSCLMQNKYNQNAPKKFLFIENTVSSSVKWHLKLLWIKDPVNSDERNNSPLELYVSVHQSIYFLRTFMSVQTWTGAWSHAATKISWSSKQQNQQACVDSSHTFSTSSTEDLNYLLSLCKFCHN